MSNLWQVQDLAAAALGISEDEWDRIQDESAEDETLNQQLDERFGVDLEQFGNVVDALLPFTPIVEINGNRYHAFAIEKNGVGRCLVKKPAQVDNSN